MLRGATNKTDKTAKTYKIGELARQSGVAIKTIRFYSDIGLLPTVGQSEGGHRLYSDVEYAQLEAIRSLRELGFDLDTIQKLLDDKDSGQDHARITLQLQLDAVELKLKALKRQQSLLKFTLEFTPVQHAQPASSNASNTSNNTPTDSKMVLFLRAAQAHAALAAHERQRFLRQQLERLFEGVPADPAWLAQVWQGDLLELPADLSEPQVLAWLELAALVADTDFIERSRQTGLVFWRQFTSPAAHVAYAAAMAEVNAASQQAVQDGVLPTSALGQQAIGRYVQAHAEAFGQAPDQALARHLLAQIAAHSDPRAERFWQLVGLLKGWPQRVASVTLRHQWQVAALEHYAVGDG
jgi:DNA-binding transcriptional MerR regulator